MTARALDGTATAARIKSELRTRVEDLARSGHPVGLGTLLVGGDPASRSYVGGKHRDSSEVGIGSFRVELPADATTAEVLDAVGELNADPRVSGFITQLPFPPGIDQSAVIGAIDPRKDADGLHPASLGRLVLDGASAPVVPCTPAGILELLERNDVTVAGAEVTIVGRGITVGRPLALLLSARGIDATVTVVHSRTSEIAAAVRRASIVVAAIGEPHFVKADWVKPGAAVLDVGVTRIGMTDHGRARLAGDVDPAVAEVAGWLSPNPGGVGPMTRAMLLRNVVSLAERASRSRLPNILTRRAFR